MKINRSEWPTITSAADVGPFWQTITGFRDRYAALGDDYAEAEDYLRRTADPIPPRKYYGADGRLGESSGGYGVMAEIRSQAGILPFTSFLGYLDQLAGLPDAVQAETDPVTAADFDRAGDDWWDLRPAAAYWSNRLGLDHLRSGRHGDQKTATRSHLRALDQHLTRSLLPAMTDALGRAGSSFDATAGDIADRFAAAERHRQEHEQQQRRTPMPAIAAQLRNH